MMKNRWTYISSLLAVVLLALAGGPGQAQEADPQGEAGMQAALGTAFTYQGQLRSGGSPVNGNCDFQFSLWDAVSGGTQIGATQSKVNMSVSEGFFTIPDLDFGSVFSGDARWLQIAVRCPAGSGGYTDLSPRQALTAAPYALYSKVAPWSGLIGIPAGFADGVDNDNTYTAGTGLTLAGTQFSLNTVFTDSRYWQLAGNSLSAEGNLGILNNYALNFLVNSQRALRLEPNTSSPNLIGGYSGNNANPGVYGAVIGGGGAAGGVNRVTDDYGTVGGGLNNRAGDSAGTTSDQIYATIGGGYGNVAHAGAAIGGGQLNIASGLFAAIGGGVENTAVYTGTTVSGGWSNAASHDYAAVGGGAHNTASGPASTVSGGWANLASGESASVGGGDYNVAAAAYATIAGGGPLDPTDPTNTNNRVTDDYGTIGGGGQNRAGNGDSDTTNVRYATVGGGAFNTARGPAATIGGGAFNTVSGESATIGGGDYNLAAAPYATVGGGWGNKAIGKLATIGGGDYNLAAAAYTTIAGGGPRDPNDITNTNNRVTDDYSTIGGGGGNRAGSDDGDTTDARYATVGGGINNTASSQAATVGGGWNNTASGNAATVPGGASNVASGAYSFAAGAQAQATHDGSFVWSSTDPTSSWGDNTFTVRAHGGARFYSATGTGTGVQLASGGGSWSNLSDRAAKENFAPVDGRDLLNRLAAVPIQTWNYKSQDASIRHIGPVAQDFYTAFGVGEDDTHITTVDADGVALAGIQELYELSQEQAARIVQLEQENADMRSRLDDLETRLAALEGQGGGISTPGGLPILAPVTCGLAVLGAVAYRRREGGGR